MAMMELRMISARCSWPSWEMKLRSTFSVSKGNFLRLESEE